MFREIKKKQIILENRKPYNSQTCGYISELDRTDWVYSSMRLDGSALAKHQVERILKGEFIESANLNEHVVIEKHHSLFKACNDMLALSCSLNKEMILSFAQKLTEDTGACYRKENPVLVSLSYNPPHPSEIEEQMDILMNWFYSDDMETNPVLKAACLHNRIIEIYPFDLYSEAIARAAMYYFLMERGYHPFELNLSEQEYNTAIAEYLKNESSESFYSAVERGVYNKMEVLMQLTESLE